MFRFQIDDTCELRLLQPYHAEALFALTDANRAHLRMWLPWLDGVKTVADSKSFIEATLRQFAANNGFQTGIWYQEGQVNPDRNPHTVATRGGEAGSLSWHSRPSVLAGVIGYHYIDWGHRSTALGYWLGEAYQGHGLITRAARALTDYALNDLKLNRIELRCATGNLRSCAVAKRLGYRHEGVIRQAEWLYDHFVDHDVYSMLAQDWQSPTTD